MNRRAALGAVGFALSSALVGCVEDLPRDDSSANSSTQNRSNGPESNPKESLADDYEQCHLVAIDFEWLPDELKAEVNEAMDDGGYEAERIGLLEAIDSEQSSLVIGDMVYEFHVESEGNQKRLSLESVEYITAPEPRTISVENTTDREHQLQLTLTGEGTLVDETMTVPAGEHTQITATDRFGSFDLTVRLLTGHESEAEFRFDVNDSAFDGIVAVTEDDVAITQEVADIAPCEWDDTIPP